MGGGRGERKDIKIAKMELLEIKNIIYGFFLNEQVKLTTH